MLLIVAIIVGNLLAKLVIPVADVPIKNFKIYKPTISLNHQLIWLGINGNDYVKISFKVFLDINLIFIYLKIFVLISAYIITTVEAIIVANKILLS